MPEGNPNKVIAELEILDEEDPVGGSAEPPAAVAVPVPVAPAVAGVAVEGVDIFEM